MDVAKVCTIHNSGLFVVATKLFITGMLLIFVVHLYGAEPVNEQEAERKWEHDERYLELERELDALLAETVPQRELECKRYTLEHLVRVAERPVLTEHELRERAILKKAVCQSIRKFDKKCLAHSIRKFDKKSLAHEIKRLANEQIIHILVHNANVPIESMKVFEKDATVQEAMPRSPKNRPPDRALWDISVRREGCPYLLSLVVHGMQYQALIPSVGKGYGDELMLIQENVQNGFALHLAQTDEGADYETTKSIRLVDMSLY